MKKEILKLTGLTEEQFYKKFPTQAAFETAYPKFKLGGLTEAFPQIATADNFFSYGVPVPPTYYMHGGPTVYPQIQTEEQFFSPVYSNSNNAYAVGGSYTEAFPQAKVYPQGPVGGSSFYMMQDGGQGMSEPQKDQTFYTQKMNSFFDKLRQAAYNNLQSGIMNSEPDTTSATPELGMGRRGGMLSYQSNTSTGQTTTPAAAAAAPAATTTTTPNYQTVTAADGQTYIVGPNNQLYSPFKGNQATTTNTQQQAYNPYPYRNRNGTYIGSGLDNVANFLIPNNQREQYRNIREQQGLGISDLTPEQLKAIQSGAANVADINFETRRALFPKNRLKSVNIKFRNPVTGQMQTAAADPASAAATNPAATTTTTTNPATTSTNPSAANPASTTTTNPAATTTTTTTPAATTQATTAASTTSTTPSAAPKQDVNAVVAQMQADARAKGMANASFEGAYSDEDLLPADDRMRMQSEKNAIDEQFKNYDNYKKMKDIQMRLGMTPDEFDFNRNYDYGTKQAVAPGAPVQSSVPSAATTTPTTTTVKRAPAKANSKDSAATKQKKAGYNDPNKYINQDFIDSVRNQARGANGLPPINVQAPADTIDTTSYPGVYAAPGTPKYNGDNLPFRMGGPYVLPMYQGMVGPGEVDQEAFGPYAEGLGQAPQDPMDPGMSPYGPYADGYRFEPEQEEFEVGLNFGRTKKKGVNPYAPAMVRFAADKINQYRENAAQDRQMNKMLRADQVFNTFDQFRGDYTMNQPAGANFRPDQMVPVGNTGAGYMAQQGGPMMFDVADLFFLTPQMLKKTTSRR